MKHTIAMVSDYFLPYTGGIEVHIYQLSLALQNLGNKVIIITHKYKPTESIKYSKEFIGSLKTYYLNIPVLCSNTSWPLFFTSANLLAEILINEKIQIIHAHQSMSPLGLECVILSNLLNIKSVFTDHSFFECGAFENILVNWLCQSVLHKVGSVICVSYGLKENFVCRNFKDFPEKVHVIGNAVSDQFFERDTKIRKIMKNRVCRLKKLHTNAKIHMDNINKPRKNPWKLENKKKDVREKNFNIIYMKDTENRTNNQKNKTIIPIKNAITHQKSEIRKYPLKFFFKSRNIPKKVIKNEIKIVTTFRFVYRKGIDLLIKSIPGILALDSRIKLIVIGDGPRRDSLDQAISNIDRVILTGMLNQKEICSILKKCDIFLCTSLTESFCMAIVEGAACGLKVVATDVGAVREILPSWVVKLVEINEKSIVAGIKECMEDSGFLFNERNINSNSKLNLNMRHRIRRFVRKTYSWHRVAIETVKVYDQTKFSVDFEYNGVFGFYFRGAIIIMWIFGYFYGWIK